MNYLAYQHTKKPLELSDISRPIFWLIISVFVMCFWQCSRLERRHRL